MDELVADPGTAPSSGRPHLLPWPDRSNSHDRRDEILRSELMQLVRDEADQDMGEDDIGRLVDEAIASFAGARVRNFVSILAQRHVRIRLRSSAMPDPSVPDPQSP
ncbi:MAG: three-helix bundle dimerization domain-containing protein [Actinomycetota bacterium]